MQSERVEAERTAPRGNTGALIRSVALPTEHGGWSFVLEPIALGLAVAWSMVGLVLGVGVLGAFLAHQPLKTAIKDRLAGRRAFRTVWAERFAAIYSVVAVAAIGLVVWSAGWRVMWLPVAALPFALAQLVWDARNKSRAIGAEICGSIALGSVASAIAMADGWTAGLAAGLWLIAVARALPAIVYVRARLKLERNKPFTLWPTAAWHAGAVAVTAATAAAGWTPWLAMAAMIVLFARALHGLSKARVGRKPAAIGAQEIGFGALTVVLAAIGYATGL